MMLFSSPLRRWLLATLLLPVAAFALSRFGLFLQRRNAGTPTRLSRAPLSASNFTRRLSSRRNDDAAQRSNTVQPAVTAPTSSAH
jgi:hypothetical protein